ncbi:RNA-binding protein CP29B, chloroplastic-like protein [Drosera capensis]
MAFLTTTASSISIPSLTFTPKLLANTLPIGLNFKPISSKPNLSLSFSSNFNASISSRFARNVAISDEIEEDEGERAPRFAPELRLFVGNLAFSVDSAKLAGVFETAGSVEMVEVIYDKVTGRSRGFGFVTMSTVEDVEAAAEQLNGYELEGRLMRVNAGPPPPKNVDFYNSRGPSSGRSIGGGGGGGRSTEHRLHVSNLSWGVDDLSLKSLFSEHGDVVESRVIYDRETGRSRGFGFVSFSSAEEVNNALEALDGADADRLDLRRGSEGLSGCLACNMLSSHCYDKVIFHDVIRWDGYCFLLIKARGQPWLSEARAGTFNYDENFKGATARPVASLEEDKQLKEAGFALNHARVVVGSGMETFEKGKAALQTWSLTGLLLTPIKTGVKFCVCVNEFLPWLMMPLQIAYVDEDKSAKKASFSYGNGTLQGHLLVSPHPLTIYDHQAGEERFSLELEENDQVWYEILSFSKPAHLLSFIGYPYILHRQKCFTKESTKAVMKHCSV